MEHPLGSDPQDPERNLGIALAKVLDLYNNGLLGPGHCQEKTGIISLPPLEKILRPYDPELPVGSNSPTPVDESEIDRLLTQLTLNQKVAQMLMVGLPGPTLDPSTRLRIVEPGVGGVILIERNTTSAEQVLDLTQAMQKAAMRAITLNRA